MDKNQLKKEMDAYFENVLKNVLGIFQGEESSMFSKYTLLLGNEIPSEISPDILFVDTGMLDSGTTFPLAIEIPSGYYYVSNEHFQEGTTDNVTVGESGADVVINADTVESLRVIVKFEKSNLTPIPAPVLSDAFVEQSGFVTAKLSQMMIEDENLLDVDSYTVTVNGADVTVSEVTTGINTSILSIITTPAIKAGDIVSLEIDGSLMKSAYGGLLGNQLLSNIINYAVPVYPEIVDLIPLVYDYNNEIGIVAEINPNGLTGTVKLLHGFDGAFDNETDLDPIVDASNNAIRSVFIPKYDMGTFNVKVVVTLSDSTVIESDVETLTVYPGTKNVAKEVSLTTLVGTTFYIDPSAPVNGTGTEESPYNAFPALGNNNTYLIKKGTTIAYIGYGARVGVIGSCKIGAYGTGYARPILEWQVSGTSDIRFIDATNSTVVLDGIEIRSTDIFGIGTYFANSTNSCVHNCVIKGFTWGVYSESHTFSPYTLQWSGLNIWYSKFDGQGLDAINARNVTNLNIEFCFIKRANQLYWYNYPANQNQSISEGDGIQVNSACRNPADPTGALIPQVTLINNCTVDRSDTGNKMCIIIDCATANYTIVNNHLIGQRIIAGYTVNGLYLSMGTQTDASTNLVKGNVIENCAAAFAVYSNQIFAHNKVINCNTGLTINANRTSRVWNNVFFALSAMAVNKLSNASASVQNNVFVDCPQTIQFLSGGTNANSHNHFQNSTSSGTNATTGSAGFELESAVNTEFDFRIKSDSALIGSGTDVGLLLDYDNEDIATPFNKGLYEIALA